MPVWHMAYPQLWDKNRKRTAVVSVGHFAAALSISAACMWGMREWERKLKGEGCLSLSLQSTTWWVFTCHMHKWKPSIFPSYLFLTLLNSSLKRFYSRGLVCVLWDIISCTLQLRDHMEHLQSTTWNLSKTPLFKTAARFGAHEHFVFLSAAAFGILGGHFTQATWN